MKIRNSIECWINTKSPRDGQRLILLLKVAAGEYPELWQPITGGIKARETGIEACLREVKEETGLALEKEDIRELDFALDVPIPEHNWIVRKKLFIANSSVTDIILSDEHIDWQWVSVGKVRDYLYFESNQRTFTEVEKALLVLLQ